MSEEIGIQSAPLGLIKKLCSVMAEAGYIKKRGHNEKFHYDYATEADVVDALRDKLAARNVFVFPSVMQSERKHHAKTASGGDMFITDVMIRWTFVDGETGETHECLMPGCGTDTGDKGVYKAITGSSKYLFLKGFMLPTGDDPEDEKPDRAEGIKAAQSVATEKLRAHARTNGGSELVTISPYKDGFYALSGPGVPIVRSEMKGEMKAKLGWVQAGNVDMFVKEHKAHFIAFCTGIKVSVLDESSGTAPAKDERQAPVDIPPFIDDPSTDPIILEAKSMTGKKGEYVRVKWEGKDLSCFDKKLLPFILSHVGRPAMFDWSSSPDGKYKNILHVVRLSGMPFELQPAPFKAEDQDVPF